MNRSKSRVSLLLATLLAGAAVSQATEPAAVPASNGELARETSDPASELWYLNTEFTFTTEPARPFQESNTFSIELQPSLPVSLGRDWRLMNFPDLILATQGTASGTQITGIESFSWMSALGPTQRFLGCVVAVGPTVAFPVSTDSALAPAVWQAGVGGVVSYRSENMVFSTLTKALWTTSSAEGPAGSLEIQYNLQYFFGDGMQAGLGRPRIVYEWDSAGSGSWDLPVGLDVGRVFRVGKVPIKVVLEYEFYVVNDSRWQPEHLFRIMFVPVLPALF